ncbi:hypothetical protein PENNAL_c0069G10298 [Penicillium nalgiovense]|uniref:Uncharacterized protein n=1 Tax=Penicillium nalgiovense TaxID=60175 RepID=A0A1V6XM61_PENNA|nr:hypothetical protein PENNAL_c0069G10298 [Penicillium nalgiovense]
MSSLRSEDEKNKLREHAVALMSGNDKVRIAPAETTGENDFKYEQWPNVCAVVVDKGSGRGYAQITGGGEEVHAIYTGRGETGYALANISHGQSCMLHHSFLCLFHNKFDEGLAHLARNLDRRLFVDIVRYPDHK